MKALKLLLLALTAVTALASNAQSKNIEVGNFDSPLERYAFIIGNDHYQDEAISTLASCRLDAERFYSFVTSEEGYHIKEENTRVLLDAKKEQIINELETFLSQIKNPENSSVYFYYSGHGIHGALLPTDFNSVKPESGLSYEWIKKAIAKTDVASPLLIIDACYSGSIISAKNKETKSYNALSSIEGEMLPSNFTVFTATSAFRVTPAGRHSSAYTRNFLKAVKSKNTDADSNGIITAGELSAAISKLLASSNVPQFSGNDSFEMALFTKKFVDQKKIARLKRTTLTSELISWRTRVENASAQQLALEIKNLEQSVYVTDKSKLGFLYREGIGVTKDANTAIQYFILGALEDDAFALYNLGNMYYFGSGVTKNTKKAIKLYEKAAGLNDAFALYNMGCIYLSEKAHPEFYHEGKAISYFRRAANLGFSKASFKLGKIYLKKADDTTEAEKQDFYKTLAFKYLEKAASENYTNAQFFLAGLYENGSYNATNKERSNYWLKQACSSNHLIACKKLMFIAVN